MTTDTLPKKSPAVEKPSHEVKPAPDPPVEISRAITNEQERLQAEAAKKPGRGMPAAGVEKKLGTSTSGARTGVANTGRAVAPQSKQAKAKPHPRSPPQGYHVIRGVVQQSLQQQVPRSSAPIPGALHSTLKSFRPFGNTGSAGARQAMQSSTRPATAAQQPRFPTPVVPTPAPLMSSRSASVRMGNKPQVPGIPVSRMGPTGVLQARVAAPPAPLQRELQPPVGGATRTPAVSEATRACDSSETSASPPQVDGPPSNPPRTQQRRTESATARLASPPVVSATMRPRFMGQGPLFAFNPNNAGMVQFLNPNALPEQIQVRSPTGTVHMVNSSGAIQVLDTRAPNGVRLMVPLHVTVGQQTQRPRALADMFVRNSTGQLPIQAPPVVRSARPGNSGANQQIRNILFPAQSQATDSLGARNQPQQVAPVPTKPSAPPPPYNQAPPSTGHVTTVLPGATSQAEAAANSVAPVPARDSVVPNPKTDNTDGANWRAGIMYEDLSDITQTSAEDADNGSSVSSPRKRVSDAHPDVGTSVQLSRKVPKVPKFRCKECSSSFSRDYMIREHIQQKHNDVTDVDAFIVRVTSENLDGSSTSLNSEPDSTPGNLAVSKSGYKGPDTSSAVNPTPTKSAAASTVADKPSPQTRRDEPVVIDLTTDAPKETKVSKETKKPTRGVPLDSDQRRIREALLNMGIDDLKELSDIAENIIKNRTQERRSRIAGQRVQTTEQIAVVGPQLPSSATQATSTTTRPISSDAAQPAEPGHKSKQTEQTSQSGTNETQSKRTSEGPAVSDGNLSRARNAAEIIDLSPGSPLKPDVGDEQPPHGSGPTPGVSGSAGSVHAGQKHSDATQTGLVPANDPVVIYQASVLQPTQGLASQAPQAAPLAAGGVAAPAATQPPARRQK